MRAKSIYDWVVFLVNQTSVSGAKTFPFLKQLYISRQAQNGHKPLKLGNRFKQRNCCLLYRILLGTAPEQNSRFLTCLGQHNRAKNVELSDTSFSSAVILLRGGGAKKIRKKNKRFRLYGTSPGVKPCCWPSRWSPACGWPRTCTSGCGTGSRTESQRFHPSVSSSATGWSSTGRIRTRYSRCCGGSPGTRSESSSCASDRFRCFVRRIRIWSSGFCASRSAWRSPISTNFCAWTRGCCLRSVRKPVKILDCSDWLIRRFVVLSLRWSASIRKCALRISFLFGLVEFGWCNVGKVQWNSVYSIQIFIVLL